MFLTLDAQALTAYTARQTNQLFPDGNEVTSGALTGYVRLALERVEHCFRHIALPRYTRHGQAAFDHLHADQHSQYLYFLANTVYQQEGDPQLAAKLFGLNKALNGFNCMYDTQLPDIFVVAHGMGTVLGKAHYGNYFMCCHNCTIGAIRGIYPTLGEGVILSAGASIIGECRIGNNVVVGPACTVVKTDVPDNTLITIETSYALRANSDRAFQNYFIRA